MGRFHHLTALAAVFVAASVGHAEANTCLDNGICYQVSASGSGTRISFYNFPRVGDYVTQVYNVRGMSGGGPAQIEIHGYDSVPASWGAVISVQACRKRTLLNSLCTPWSNFKAF